MTTPSPGAHRAAKRDPKRRRSAAGRQMHATWLTYVILAVFLLISVFPFYWTILAASTSNTEINQLPPNWLPGGNLLKNFQAALDNVDMGKALLNSTIVASTVTLGTVLFSTLAGFAFAKLRFRGRNILLGLTIGTMMVPYQLGIVPLFLLISELGWGDTLPAVIFPTLVTAFGVFFMRQYLITALPDELIEAGRMDGASSLRIFFSIVLPTARPAMAVLGMLTFMASWNDFFWPIVVLTSHNPTVQVAINNLGSGYVPDQSIIMAGTLLGTLPVLLVFVALGRQIVGGIMQGAVKG
ncbi:carbohydrate ABC transporter permease [Streptomyces sp. AP-93]|uniref:carbohydrate ABC transporter permease n=1 Tax=Streptomyces sp. AP-93 TaxID=2929048 RepID=UPI001FAFBFDB|nr:carbohydrate ABC transporter permease [Streptomyces sp. AP-93]MCJ0867790.1 carbohydrate ABC transporter permease [Streptomyces sp. AP-93]